MAESERQIGFDQVGIASVLRGYWLHVPPNQREYSWTDREVKALFHDIANAINKDAAEYFLGSIVAIPKQQTVLEVVDGQQRLATTAILLAAIRNHLRGKEREKLIVEQLENEILASVDRHARQRVFRLRLNVRDNAYFEKRILEGDASAKRTAPSHDLIDNAANLAALHVDGVVAVVDEKHHGDALNRWIDYLEHKAIVVLLKVPSEVNAYKMFETLNDRGLRTSQSDLVKNYLFGESGERLPEAQEKWASMRGVLESIEDEDITVNYLRQMLISMHGYLREPDVFETVQTQAAGASGSIQFLATLEAGASDYAAVGNPEHEKWNDYRPSTRRAIRTLGLVRIRPMRPLLLAIARVMNPQETDKALRMLINVSVRFLIVGGSRTGSVEEILAYTAQAVSKRSVNTASSLLAALEKTVPSDTQFAEVFKTAAVVNAALARYYLRCMEMTVKNQEFPCYVPNDDQQIINLEHILPRVPQENWPQYTEEQAELYYRRLGNLALLQARENKELASASFAEKQRVYATSPFELTSQIAELSDWTPKEITARQSVLAELALKTWPFAVD